MQVIDLENFYELLLQIFLLHRDPVLLFHTKLNQRNQHKGHKLDLLQWLDQAQVLFCKNLQLSLHQLQKVYRIHQYRL